MSSARRSSWLFWGKTRQSINSSTNFALSVIAPNVVFKELLGSAKRARKTVRVLTEARVLCWRRTNASINVLPNRWPLQLFRPLRFFGLFWWFFDFLTTFWPTCQHHHQPHHTRPLSALVDESVDELVLSIEVSGAAIVRRMKLPCRNHHCDHHHHQLHQSHACQLAQLCFCHHHQPRLHPSWALLTRYSRSSASR